jgi:hypothetical protein
LFLKEYHKDLTDETWDFLYGFTNKSLMIVYLDGNDVVGMANLIHNYHAFNQKSFEYFIFTTSIVSQEFRRKGIYTLIMLEIRKHLESSNSEFILAYPNDLALPIITSPFYRFKIVSNFSLRVLNDLNGINSCDIRNFTKLSKSYIKWRFSKYNYYLLNHLGKILICKDFNDEIDVIELFNESDFDFELFSMPLKTTPKDSNFILPSFRLIDPSKGESIHEQKIVLCSRKNSKIFECDFDFSNLCWDIM